MITLQPHNDTPLVHVTLPPFDGALTLQLPELISDRDRRLVYYYTNLDRGVHWERRADGSLTATWRQEGLAAYELTAMPQADGLALEWTISNRAMDEWPYAAGTVCMRSHDLPDVYDPTAERTFMRRSGAWVPVRETWAGPGGNWYFPPGREPCNLMRPLLAGGSWRHSDFRPDEAVVAIRSRDGQWLLAQAWAEARYLIANIHDGYACTDVCPSLGDVACGATVRVQGKIYWFRGSLEELAAKYQNEFSSEQ